MGIAKSFDPNADQAHFEAAREMRENNSTYTLWLDDALQEMLKVGGVTLDAWVKCQLKRQGRLGPIEIDYLDIKNVYVYFGDGMDERAKIERTTMTKTIEKAFDEALKAYLIKRGEESFSWEIVDHG